MSIVHPIQSQDELDIFMKSQHKLIVLDIYADWCGPCKMLAPQMEALAHEYASYSVKFGKINTEHVAVENVNSLPTIQLWVSNGATRTLKQTVVGANIQAIREAINECVLVNSSSQFNQSSQSSASTGKPVRKVGGYATYGNLK